MLLAAAKRMQRRQARSDLAKLRVMSDLDLTRVAMAASRVWFAVCQQHGFLIGEPVDSMALDPNSPIKVSSVRIAAAAANASNTDLLALSLWQSTARVSNRHPDAELRAIVSDIWQLLSHAEDTEEHFLASDARMMAESVLEGFNYLNGERPL